MLFKFRIDLSKFVGLAAFVFFESEYNLSFASTAAKPPGWHTLVDNLDMFHLRFADIGSDFHAQEDENNKLVMTAISFEKFEESIEMATLVEMVGCVLDGENRSEILFFFILVEVCPVENLSSPTQSEPKLAIHIKGSLLDVIRIENIMSVSPSFHAIGSGCEVS